TGIATSGDFAQNNTCGTSLAVGASCKISVTFSPADTGSRAGALIISDNVASSPHMIALSGTGTGPAPVASLSATSLTFTSPGPGSPVLTQTVTLTNTGDAALNISRITIGGPNQSDFSQSNTCGNVVNPGGNCSFAVTFAPTATSGTETATLAITDDATNSPQTIALAGTIEGSVASFSPTSLYFPSQPVGTTSTALPVTVKVQGTTAYSIQSIMVSGDFAQSNNCGASIPGNSSCTINVTFNPTTTGDRAGNLTILHLGLASIIGLYGSGGDFSISVSNSTATITAGQTAEYQLSLTPIGGFNQTVALSCGGAPQGATCLLPSSTASNGMNVVGFTVTVYTTAPSMVAPRPRTEPHSPYGLPAALELLAVFTLALLTTAATVYNGPRVALKRAPAIVLATTLSLVLAWAACGGGGGGVGGGGGGNQGTPAGTYTLTVTGTYVAGSTALARSVKLTLTVN